jgi:pyruvate-formate lyase-activating enzyme
MVNKKILRENASTKKRYWLRLTRTCNNHCVFCLDKEAQDGSCIPLEEVDKNLIQGRKENISRVVLSGGEPTVHPQFLEIIKTAKNLGYRHIQVITNGRMFAYRDFLDSAVKAGINELTFSIHGHKASLHDKQTQVKGSFQQTLTGLMNALKMPNLIVNVDVVISRFNVKYLADTLKYFINLGISEFDLLQVIPFGNAWDNRERVLYNIDESLTYLKQAFQLSKDPNLYIWTNRFPAQYLEGFEDLIQHPVKLYDEIRGRKEMLEQFLSNGQTVDCRGERCQYCFLEDFCQDLVEFKKRGHLYPKNIPLCLSRFKIVRGNNFKSKMLKKNAKINIFKILDFYINHRYFIKSLRCNECKFNVTCQGAHINHIRHNGFELLNPVK